MWPFLAPVFVGTGPVSVLPRLMDQLIISVIRVCFVPGVGARSEYRVTAPGIRGIIPAQTSSMARLLGQSVVIVIIIITDTEQKTLHQSLPICPTYNLNLTSQNWRFQVARKRAGRLETSLQSWFLFLLNNFCCLIISVEVTKRKIQT